MLPAPPCLAWPSEDGLSIARGSAAVLPRGSPTPLSGQAGQEEGCDPHAPGACDQPLPSWSPSRAPAPAAPGDNRSPQCIVPIEQVLQRATWRSVLQPCHHPPPVAICGRGACPTSLPRTAAGRSCPCQEAELAELPKKVRGGPTPIHHPGTQPAPVHCPHRNDPTCQPPPQPPPSARCSRSTSSLPQSKEPVLGWVAFLSDFVIYTIITLHSHFQLLYHSG